MFATVHSNPERIIAVSVILSDIMYSNLYVEKAQTSSGAGAAGDLALEPEPEPDGGPPGDGESGIRSSDGTNLPTGMWTKCVKLTHRGTPEGKRRT